MSDLEILRNYLNTVRRDFANRPLDEASVPDSPYTLFENWFDQAVGAQVLDPYAMIVSTAGLDRQPSSRVVYMRDISEKGLIFYTNFNSQKGNDILENPRIAALFFWGDLDRQIRVEGSVEKAGDDISDAYFASRPRESQIGAWASEQSSIISSRAALEERVSYFEQQFKGKDVPRPEGWGGYLILPSSFEFWQGRPSRLHDRIKFTKTSSGWDKQRLAP